MNYIKGPLKIEDSTVTMGYGGVLGSSERSEEDGCWYGKILGISDIITYEGEDYNDLRKAFQHAVDEWHADRINLSEEEQ